MAGDDLRPLAETLSAAAFEMAEMERLAEGLQVVIADLVAHGGVIGAHGAVECQAADALTQRLAGMAAFFRHLAVNAPPDARIDAAAAAEGLTLADQAVRLAGSTVGFEPSNAGELELFGG